MLSSFFQIFFLAAFNKTKKHRLDNSPSLSKVSKIFNILPFAFTILRARDMTGNDDSWDSEVYILGECGSQMENKSISDTGHYFAEDR
jgi:hypothetical protein